MIVWNDARDKVKASINDMPIQLSLASAVAAVRTTFCVVITVWRVELN